MKILDGHNLIGAGAACGLSLEQPDKEARLLRLLVAHRSRRRSRERTLVVFDGHHGRLAVGPRRYSHGGVDVEIAIGESADAVILRRVRGAAHPREITVVTSDGAVLRGAASSGAKGMRASEFFAEVQAAAPAGAEEAEKPEAPGPDEVAEWIERFGEGR